MKNGFKKIISIFMVITMVLCSSIVSFAEEKENKEFPSAMFKEVCNDFFSDYENYKVTNPEGEELSQAFYQLFVSDYERNQYEEIWQYFLDNELEICSFTKYEIPKQQNSLTRANKTVQTSDYSYKLQKIESGGKVSSVEVKCIVNGRFTYNPNTGKILSASTTSVNMDYTSPGVCWTISQKNPYTKTAKISSDGYSVTFAGGFSIVAQFTYNYVPYPSNTYSGFYHSYKVSGE